MHVGPGRRRRRRMCVRVKVMAGGVVNWLSCPHLLLREHFDSVKRPSPGAVSLSLSVRNSLNPTQHVGGAMSQCCCSIARSDLLEMGLPGRSASPFCLPFDSGGRTPSANWPLLHTRPSRLGSERADPKSEMDDDILNHTHIPVTTT